MTIQIFSVQDELPKGFSDCSKALMSLIVSRSPEIDYWSIAEFYEPAQTSFELGYFISTNLPSGKTTSLQNYKKFDLNHSDSPNDIFEFFSFHKDSLKIKKHQKIHNQLNQCVTLERRFKGLAEPAFKGVRFRYKNSLGLWCSNL